MGAGLGKMICPQSIAIGSAAAGLEGAESKILSATIRYTLLFVVIAGLLCYGLPALGLV